MGGRNWVGISSSSDVLATLDEKRSIVLRDLMTGCDHQEFGHIRQAVARRDQPRWSVSWPPVVILRRRSVCGNWQKESSSGPSRGTPNRWSAWLSARTANSSHPGASTRPCASGTFRRPQERLVYRGHSKAIGTSHLARTGEHSRPRAWITGSPVRFNCGTPRPARTHKNCAGHSTFVRRLSFHPDGRRLVSLGDDGALKLWDLASGQETLSIPARQPQRPRPGREPRWTHDRDLGSGVSRCAVECDTRRQFALKRRAENWPKQ